MRVHGAYTGRTRNGDLVYTDWLWLDGWRCRDVSQIRTCSQVPGVKVLVATTASYAGVKFKSWRQVQIQPHPTPPSLHSLSVRAVE